MWEYFHKIFVNNVQEQFVSCDKCKTILAFTLINGTNNMKTHFNCCSNTKIESSDPNQTKVHDFYPTSQIIDVPRKIKLAIAKAYAEFSALDGRAFETMKGDGFDNVAQVLFEAGSYFPDSSIQVQHILPHPTTISRGVMQIYEHSKQQLIQICKDIKSFCVVVDSWSEKYTGINYCDIGLRFTDENFKLLSFILGCYVYDAPNHAAVHFREFVDSKLQEYNSQLDSSKFVVSDNEPKMLAAFRDNCQRIGCSDHYLNKQLQHAFESSEIHLNKNILENVNCTAAQNIFSLVKNIVVDIRRSHRQQQQSMKLQVYSETRFNGALTMLDIFRKAFYELSALLTNTKSMDSFNLIDKKSLDDICCFLQPFDEVIQSLSEDHRPTLHKVIPYRQCLINKCEINEEDSTVIAELQAFLVRRMKTAWLITNEHRLATILHHKLKNFECCHGEKENAISALKSAFDQHKVNILSPSSCVSKPHQVTLPSSSNINKDVVVSKSKSLLVQCFDMQVDSTMEIVNPHQEIDVYLNSEFCCNHDGNGFEDGDIDILSYWREKQNQFPILSFIAKQIYMIPASNTTVERLFSSSKNMISEKRTNIGSEKLNQLLFLQKNLNLLKQLSNDSRRKRTISMSSTTTISSEDSTCTMPKQSKLDHEESESISDDAEIFLD
ncbi:unnamed protein product [Rotaria magnacalcarata]|uniref:HAT C-terminal dimerisation domain-containing protein n=1 Tax=Rotaria magnacalcarata TaxID=392030 RepID=A0A816MNT8_9BILA|nr:unnamed protein product [Rotaria magnacalcarata]CAF3952026.1 unnamed protein product [Rotaria magnacalcarata]